MLVCLGEGQRVASQRGFTFVGLLISVAVIGLGLSVVGVHWAHDAQRQREAELLFAGAQLQRAIKSYYEQSPGRLKKYPTKLEDLLLDTRYVTVRRHLRKIYRDPITNSHDWGLALNAEGNLVGVFSKSEAKPLQGGGINKLVGQVPTVDRYADWKFAYVPGVSSTAVIFAGDLVNP